MATLSELIIFYDDREVWIDGSYYEDGFVSYSKDHEAVDFGDLVLWAKASLLGIEPCDPESGHAEEFPDDFEGNLLTLHSKVHIVEGFYFKSDEARHHARSDGVELKRLFSQWLKAQKVTTVLLTVDKGRLDDVLLRLEGIDGVLRVDVSKKNPKNTTMLSP